MNAQLNDYFYTQRLVKEFKEAEPSTVYDYQEKFHKGLMLTGAISCLLSIIMAFILMSQNFLILFFVIGFLSIGLARFGYSLVLPVLITKGIVYLFLDGKIDEKASKIKRNSRNELYLLKDVIESMTKAEKSWREVAEDAIAIKEYRLN